MKGNKMKRKRNRRYADGRVIKIAAIALLALFAGIVFITSKQDAGKSSSVSKSSLTYSEAEEEETEKRDITSEDMALAAGATVIEGTVIDSVDVGGLTVEEAIEKIEEHLREKTLNNINLDVDGNVVTCTVADLGYYWSNKEIVYEAAGCGIEGNIIERYKSKKNAETNAKSYEVVMSVDDATIRNAISEKCGAYNIPHVNASLTRVGSSFQITPESFGRIIDMDTTVEGLTDYLLNQWNGGEANYSVTMQDDAPTCTSEDCSKVTSILGTYSTTFSTGSSNASRNQNMKNGMRLLDGITLCQGETMSVNSYLEPWTADNGWEAAGTYVNGQVEDSLGGGICQVSSTLYNAALFAELGIVQRQNHSLTVGYVPLSQDAALAGTWKDLKLQNNTDAPIYIEAVYQSGKLTFNIYGHETRDSGRTLKFVSETLSTIPAGETVTEDPTKPAGYRAVTSKGHVGYKARLIKQVYQDGVLQSEEVINSSYYQAANAEVVVGTGTGTESESSSETSAAAEGETTQPADAAGQPADGTQTETQVAETQAAQPETQAAETQAAQPETQAAETQAAG